VNILSIEAELFLTERHNNGTRKNGRTDWQTWRS